MRTRDLEADGIVAEVVFPNTVPPFFPTGQIVAPAPGRTTSNTASRACARTTVGSPTSARRDPVAVPVSPRSCSTTSHEAVADVRLGEGARPRRHPLAGRRARHPVDRAAVLAGVRPAVGCLPGARAAGHAPCRGQWHPELRQARCRRADVRAWRRGSSRTARCGTSRCPASSSASRGLAFVMTEQGSGWLPAVLAQMDDLHRQTRDGRIGELAVAPEIVLPRPPSDYFRTNCYLGASFPAPQDAPVIEQIGVERVMWGSDYPHHEATTPYTRESLRRTFSELGAGAAPASPRRNRRRGLRLRPAHARADRRHGAAPRSTRSRSARPRARRRDQPRVLQAVSNPTARRRASRARARRATAGLDEALHRLGRLLASRRVFSRLAAAAGIEISQQAIQVLRVLAPRRRALGRGGGARSAHGRRRRESTARDVSRTSASSLAVRARPTAASSSSPRPLAGLQVVAQVNAVQNRHLQEALGRLVRGRPDPARSPAPATRRRPATHAVPPDLRMITLAEVMARVTVSTLTFPSAVKNPGQESAQHWVDWSCVGARGPDAAKLEHCAARLGADS